MCADKGLIPGSYAWVVLLACTVIQFLTDGILKSFGLFYVEIIAEFKESVSFTTMITGIMQGVYCLSSLPVMTCIIKTVSPRGTLMIGSIITAAGYSLSCFAPNIYFLFFSISTVVGFGLAFVFPPSIFALGTYFTKRRATANGIAISGCCLGGLLCPPLIQCLIKSYDLRGALLLTGALLLHNLPMSCLLRPAEAERSDAKNNVTYQQENFEDKKDTIMKIDKIDYSKKLNSFEMNNFVVELKKSNSLSENNVNIFRSQPDLTSKYKSDKDLFSVKESIYKTNSEKYLAMKPLVEYQHENRYLSSSGMLSLPVLDIDNDINYSVSNESNGENNVCKLFTDYKFVLFIIANSFATVVAATFLHFLPLHARQHDTDDDRMVILVSLSGAMDLIGRILCGIIVDKTKLKPYQIIALSQAVCGIIYNCNPFLTSYPGLIIFCIFIGLFSGMYLPLKHSMIVDIVGTNSYPFALAITTVSQLPVYIVGPLVFGILRDKSGNFEASYHFIGVIALISAGLFLCGSLINKCTNV